MAGDMANPLVTLLKSAKVGRDLSLWNVLATLDDPASEHTGFGGSSVEPGTVWR